MKHLYLIIHTLLLFVCPIFYSFAQHPNLGTASDFVLFSSNGAVTNSGTTHLTGNVGTNNGSCTAFGNVDGVMHSADGSTAQAAADLLVAYNYLASTTANFFPSSTLGNGDTLTPGVYSIPSAATLNLQLYLNAKGNANAVFIFKIQGAFSTNALSKIQLINNAKACNVFWKVEGMVNMATGTKMRGTVIANNAAIDISAGDTLEGRALSTTGAITVHGILAYMPLGCGSPTLTGPSAPNLGNTGCYSLFSASGAVANSGVSQVTGNIGTNVGSVSGFNPNNVNGVIHPNPDAASSSAAADLSNIYTYLNTLPYDIQLLFPAQLGGNLTLTPHTYWLNGATVLTDTLFLNAQGNPNAVFVLKINGALSTSTYSKVVLMNGAQAKNVFWKVDGAVSINNYSIFSGTLVCNNAAINLNTGVTVNGRAFATTGAIATAAVKIVGPTVCNVTGTDSYDDPIPTTIRIAPNPFNSYTNITLSDISQLNTTELVVYSLLGEELITASLSRQTTRLETSKLPAGIYFYKISQNNTIIQSGRLISQK